MGNDILEVWHPINVAAKIRSAIKGHSYKAAAAIMSVPTGDLMVAIEHPYRLEPRLAASLHKFGLNGQELFLRACERSYEMERLYETGEIKRPDWKNDFHEEEPQVPVREREKERV